MDKQREAGEQAKSSRGKCRENKGKRGKLGQARAGTSTSKTRASFGLFEPPQAPLQHTLSVCFLGSTGACVRFPTNIDITRVRLSTHITLNNDQVLNTNAPNYTIQSLPLRAAVSTLSPSPLNRSMPLFIVWTSCELAWQRHTTSNRYSSDVVTKSSQRVGGMSRRPKSLTAPLAGGPCEDS